MVTGGSPSLNKHTMCWGQNWKDEGGGAAGGLLSDLEREGKSGQHSRWGTKEAALGEAMWHTLRKVGGEISVGGEEESREKTEKKHRT